MWAPYLGVVRSKYFQAVSNLSTCGWDFTFSLHTSRRMRLVAVYTYWLILLLCKCISKFSDCNWFNITMLWIKQIKRFWTNILFLSRYITIKLHIPHTISNENVAISYLRVNRITIIKMGFPFNYKLLNDQHLTGGLWYTYFFLFVEKGQLQPT